MLDVGEDRVTKREESDQSEDQKHLGVGAI